ncbi:MAG: hypothetical protein IJZ72_03335 [Oscillospiraceae bacterium]|nr:hypothetical protein [Oscillospiraceae bacterium]
MSEETTAKDIFDYGVKQLREALDELEEAVKSDEIGYYENEGLDTVGTVFIGIASRVKEMIL